MAEQVRFGCTLLGRLIRRCHGMVQAVSIRRIAMNCGAQETQRPKAAEEAAMALNEEAQRLREEGRLQEARAASESALRMLPEGLANRRQSEAYLLQNLVLTGTALGRLAAAEAAFRRALDIWNGSPARRVAAQQQLGQLLIEPSRF